MSVDDLKSKHDELVRRLKKGDQMIQVARDRGEDVSRWEDAWNDLLHAYEQTFRELESEG